jgi:hypothetical protein
LVNCHGGSASIVAKRISAAKFKRLVPVERFIAAAPEN